MSRPFAPRPPRPTAAGTAAVPSPCINVCRMQEATGWCEGCWRTIDEIASWSSLDDASKREVWSRLEQRRSRGVCR